MESRGYSALNECHAALFKRNFNKLKLRIAIIPKDIRIFVAK